MIPEIIAGIGLGKLSEEVIKDKETINRERAEEFLIDASEDEVDWCPEMDWQDEQ